MRVAACYYTQCVLVAVIRLHGYRRARFWDHAVAMELKGDGELSGLQRVCLCISNRTELISCVFVTSLRVWNQS